MFTIIVIAIAFGAMGIAAFAAPERIVAIFGTPTLTRDGRNEVRAVYGGFGVAVAAMLVWSLYAPSLQLGIVVAIAVALGGMAAGRLVSAVIDGSPGRFSWLFFGLEVAAAGALGYAA